MASVKIKINQKKISSKVNKFQLKWAIKFLRRKIKNTQSNVEIKVEFILIDYFSENIEKYKNKYIINDIKESFSINPLSCEEKVSSVTFLPGFLLSPCPNKS